MQLFKSSLVTVFTTIISIAFFSNSVISQTDSRTKYYVTIGSPGVLFGGETSFSLNGSIGIEHPVNDIVVFEAQITAAQHVFDRQYGGFVHDGGFIEYYTGFAGMRFYWFGAQKKHPVFTNLLMGGGWWFEEEFNGLDVLVNKNTSTAMLSSATYIAFYKRVLTGFSLKGGVANDIYVGFFSADIGFRF